MSDGMSRVSRALRRGIRAWEHVSMCTSKFEKTRAAGLIHPIRTFNVLLSGVGRGGGKHKVTQHQGPWQRAEISQGDGEGLASVHINWKTPEMAVAIPRLEDPPAARGRPTTVKGESKGASTSVCGAAGQPGRARARSMAEPNPNACLERLPPWTPACGA